MADIFIIHENDNVGIALEPLQAGDNISVGDKCIIACTDIPVRHKIALQDIPCGTHIIKYGYPIGIATCDIAKGNWVHTHNVSTTLSENCTYTYRENETKIKPTQPASFDGYIRKDGRVGIRNEVWIIPTVGCVNAIAKQVEQNCKKWAVGIDGLVAYHHPYGCSQLGEDHLNTQKALCGLIKHPNAGGVLVLGLGCENNRIADMRRMLGEYDEERVRFLNCQDCDDEVEEAAMIVKELCELASKDTRTPCSSDNLIIGLKCGGSDGFSGITANPLVGEVADRVVSEGGSVLLTEVPEMFGAETILMERCVDEMVFHKMVDLINGFKEYFRKNDQPIDSNPSPGNKAGGITTLEEKSLGCVQKGGTAAICEVLSYGDRIQKSGLNVLCGPGNDLVSSNALAISGAQMVLFTTGMGTPFGCPVPTLKISSNSALYNHKSTWIDFDAGLLLAGTKKEELADRLYHFILDVASGRVLAKSEKLDKSDLAIFKNGVTL